MREQSFNYNYYLTRLNNLLRFGYQNYFRKTSKTIAQINNSLFYYREVLPLFNQNIKEQYVKIKKIDFTKLGLSKREEEAFFWNADEYVLKGNYQAVNTINSYYNLFLDKERELKNLHSKLKEELNLYKNIVEKFYHSQGLTKEEITFISAILSKTGHLSLEEKYCLKISLLWDKNPEFQMSAGSTLGLVNFKYKQVPVSHNGVKKEVDAILKGTVSTIEKNYNRKELDEYFHLLDTCSLTDKRYIISSLINFTVDNICSLKDILLSDDFEFTDIKELDTVINSYNYYLFLISYLNSKLMNITKDLKEEISLPDTPSANTKIWEDDITRRLILSSNDYSSFDKKSYIERDLEVLPNECYSKIRQLLTNFEIGNVTGYVTKKLVTIPNLYEIKYNDQIRILFSFGPNNTLIIKGVIQKKTDNDKQEYLKISKRPDVTSENFTEALEYSQERFEMMLNFLDTNARKSNRY